MMIKQESPNVERKEVAILKILKDSSEPIGATTIAHQLRNYGIDITERTVRYHLKIMDERGLTYLVGRRHGRLITESGIDELDSASVGNRVGSTMTKIEMLICQTSLEPEKVNGEVPVNISLFPVEKFSQGLEVMKSFSNTPFCSGSMVFIAEKGEKLGDFIIPAGKIGLVTLSNVTIGAVLFKAGIPLDFRFAGVLQIRNNRCHRFIDLMEYTGSTLNPYEVFMSCKRTNVNGLTRDGNGKILASFCELPAFTLPKVAAVTKGLEKMGIQGAARLGGINEPLCEIPVGTGRFGMILSDGLNLVAAAVEAGIEVENHASCSLFEFTRMRSLCDI
jgi:repressor of nif and glnA expression